MATNGKANWVMRMLGKKNPMNEMKMIRKTEKMITYEVK